MLALVHKALATVRILAAAASFLSPVAAQAVTTQQAFDASASGFAWLASIQNVDGSWGQAAGQKMVYTAETVQALWVHNRKGLDYQRGVAWLENHPASNVDHAARRFRALARNDAQVVNDEAAILLAKSLANPPIADLSGWGVQARDQADSLDTALVLIALGEQAPNTFFAQHADAVSALIASSTGAVWSIGQNPQGTPFAGDVLTTVNVAEALRLCRTSTASICSSAGQAQTIGSLLSTAELLLQFAMISDPLGKALRARYFGRYRNQVTPGSADGMIDLLVQSQISSNGSWSNDPLVTAMALQALAGWMQLDSTGQESVVTISDPRLRRAVNRSLGKPAMDAVTVAEVQTRLVNLDASYLPLDNLAALGAAPNLRTIDISGNPCLVDDPNINTILVQLFPGLQTITKRPVGDVNRDGLANSLDHWLVEKNLLGLSTFDSDTRRAADLTFDDRVDSRDLYWLGRALLDQNLSSLCP